VQAFKGFAQPVFVERSKLIRAERAKEAVGEARSRLAAAHLLDAERKHPPSPPTSSAGLVCLAFCTRPEQDTIRVEARDFHKDPVDAIREEIHRRYDIEQGDAETDVRNDLTPIG
jgi:hypothetical protein